MAALAPSQRLAQLTWASRAAGAGLAGVELVRVHVLRAEITVMLRGPFP